MFFGRLPGIPFGVQWCFEEVDKGGGSGSGGGGGTDDRPRKENPADIVAKYSGDAVRMASNISELQDDNYKLRRKRDDLQRENDTLKGNVPKDGSVVLSKEDAALWEAYKALNLKPEELKTAVSERDDFKVKLENEQTEHSKTKRGNVLRDVAQDMGYKTSVLERLDALVPGLDYEKKTVKDSEGKDVETWFATWREGEGDKAEKKSQALSEFATNRAEWKDFLPALQLDASASGQNNGQSNQSSARQVAQGSGGKPATPPDPTKSYLDKKYQRPDERDKK